MNDGKQKKNKRQELGKDQQKDQQKNQQKDQQQGNQSQSNSQSEPKSEKHQRTTAEWITLGVSAALILGLIGLITWLYFRETSNQILLEVHPQMDAVFTHNGQYYLPVKLSNTGDETAANVWVALKLTGSQGSAETAEINISFIPAHGTHQAGVSFSNDPRQGDLQITFGYIYP